jgi:hypothetical protein
MSDISSKSKILDQIYAIYDEFAGSLDLACRKYCDHCCTSDVILTTLEGYKVMNGLSPDLAANLIRKIESALEMERFRPQTTTNRLAKLYAGGIDPPQDNISSNLSDCTILADHQCPIYKLRPYGCRCLLSRKNCGENGYAKIDDFVLSVNTVFLQTIEHVDAGGCSGNLIDILWTMSDDRKRGDYSNNALHCSANRLIPNQPLEVLMIPPEHREKMEPILENLRRISILRL